MKAMDDGTPVVVDPAQEAFALEMKKQSPSDARVLGAVREAQRLGKAAKRIGYHDIEKLLAMPIDDDRRAVDELHTGQASSLIENQTVERETFTGDPISIAGILPAPSAERSQGDPYRSAKVQRKRARGIPARFPPRLTSSSKNPCATSEQWPSKCRR